MSSKRFSRAVLLLSGLLVAGAPAAPAQERATEYDGAAALGLVLRKLGTTKRVLMIGAHPDDEDTQLLATLALGQGADVAYLSLTRGEGGQNGIGPELREALGLLRTEELLAARRLDGARQFFTRAYDYGFSKSADEAFLHWPKDSVLADVVAVIRAFRPQIIVSVFSGTPQDGHGQHQAAGLLAQEAFRAAGDPTRFPEQIAQGLSAHAPQKLYQGAWFRAEEATLHIPTGELDPLLGRSYHQVAMASRSRHRSQDMGRLELPGPQWTRARRLSPPPAEEASLFAGVDTTLSAAARAVADPQVRRLLAAYDEIALRLRSELNAFAPDRLLPDLARALRLLRQADSLLARGNAAGPREALRFLIAAEQEDAQAALARAAGLKFDVVAGDERIVPGETLQLELTLWNGGARPAYVRAIEPALPAGWQATPLDPLPAGPLQPGALLTRRFEVRVPDDAAPTEPYFLRRPRAGDLYAWPADPILRGRPFEPAPFRAVARVEIAGAEISFEQEALYRAADRKQGEVRRPVFVVPAVSVSLEPALAVLPLPATQARAATRGTTRADATPLRFTLRLAAEAPEGVAGTLRLELPPGWTAEPAELPLRFERPGDRHVVEVTIQPPASIAAGDYPIRAAFLTQDGRRYDRGYSVVDYPHIRPRPLYHPAAAVVRAFDVRLPPGLRAGYVMGAGDAIPEALSQIGASVELLDAATLAAGDLGRYDAIVIGPRAYEVRPDLVVYNRRLLDYVENGGTLIVQYQQPEVRPNSLAPFPLTLTRPADRVTDENAPVRILEPAHPALSWPNRITDQDFQGWVQERGLYFPSKWDERYQALLEMNDPGEAPVRGSLLVARHGRGYYVYTGLALFRQLPAGVPGAYRLFANLLSLGRNP